jgi:phospholipid-translocating ATPase
MGLRTLVVAYKKMSFLDFKAWEKEYLQVQGILDDTRDAKVQQMQAQMETNLEYVGITAVEDRLQDGVPQAIERIKMANLRVWMLTGDKTETAVDIARSCNLFDIDTTIAYATNCSDLSETQASLQRARGKLSGAANGGLVLDGKTVYEALQDETCQQLIVELGLQSRSCVCCRLSPKQKRSLVELVVARSKGTVALSIGDGANDVPMLEGAHIGIGIRGKEGAQAVQVADVAISQFRFLVPLLFCHGRRSYWRSALFLNYYLYKSLALAMCDLIWMHQNDFAGGIAFPEWLSVNYNVFFTSLHVVFALAFDYGVSDEQSLSEPKLYRVGPARGRFNGVVFSIWMLHGIVHGSCSWIIPNLWFGGTYYDKETSKGPAEDFWVASVSSFFCIVSVVVLKLIMELQRPHALTCWLPSLGAILSLFVVMGVLGYTGIGLSFQPNMEDIPELLFTRSDARLAIIASIGASLALDLLENGVIFLTCRQRSIM